MRIVGYTRTRLIEELGEQDLEEQERDIAQYCNTKNLDMAGTVVGQTNTTSGFSRALELPVDGIVITDPLVIADDLAAVASFAHQLVEHNMHLFMIMQNKHIDPGMDNPEQELIDISAKLLRKS